MSDSFVRLIPASAAYVPTADACRQAVEIARSTIANVGLVSCQTWDEVQFFDPGANLERVVCPKCRAEIAIEKWQIWMNSAFASQFANLAIQTTCCQAEADLNALVYEWPAGFARMCLEVHSKDPGSDLTDRAILELERVLGCQLRQVFVHY